MSTTDMPAGARNMDAVATIILVGCTFAWGLNQVAIKVANGGLQPVFQAGLRSLLAGVLVLGWCRMRHIDLRSDRQTLLLSAAVGLLFGGQFMLVAIGLDYTSVARGIAMLYSMPIFVALGAHFWLGERLTLIKIVGLVAAFAGVAIVFADRLSLPSPSALIGDAMCFVGALAWATQTLVLKGSRLRFATPEKMLIYQLAVSSVMLLALAPFFGPFIRDYQPIITLAMAYQIVIVVAISYPVWFWLLKSHPAARLSVFSFITPLVSLVLGWLLLGEPVSSWLFLAVALVAAGIVLVNRREAV